MAATLVALAVWASTTAPLPHVRAMQSDRTFLGEIVPQIMQESQLADVIVGLRSTAATMERQGLVTDLVELDEVATSTAQALDDESPIGRSRIDARALHAAAQEWAHAARSFEIGVLASIGPGETTPELAPGAQLPASEGASLWEGVSAARSGSAALSSLGNAGNSMAAGDGDYAAFIGSVRAIHLRTALAPVMWAPDPAMWSRTSLAIFITDLGAASGLQPVSRVGILLVSVNPAPIPSASPSGIPTVVGSSGISVNVVVANSGNVNLQGVNAHISLAARPGSASPSPAPAPGSTPSPAAPISGARTLELGAGQQESLDFSGLQPVAGNTYTLTVSVQAPGAEVGAGTTSTTQVFTVES